MLLGLISSFGVVLGLGSLFPMRGVGFTLFIGSVLLPLSLLIGNMYLGLPLFWISLLIVGIAFFGLIKLTVKSRPILRNGWKLALLHPGLLLPMLIFIVGLFSDQATYLLWNFDEFASWGSWAKQIFVADTFWREDMETLRSYPKGWPLAIAFAHFPSDSYNEFRGIALLAIFHVALLALFFDLIRKILEIESGCSGKISFLIAWSLILLLLAAEVSWKLLPPSLLIERPVMYWSLGLFSLGLMAWYEEKTQPILFIGMGLILASALTLKTPTSSLAIPTIIIGFLYWKSHHVREIPLPKLALYLLLPFAIIAGLWIAQSSDQNVSVGFRIYFDDVIRERFFNVTALLMTAFTDYLGAYKSPLTGLGIIGLITAFWSARQRNVVIALLIFVAMSWLGLWPLYMFSILGNEHEALPSFQRYARLPIRLIHFFGLVLLAVNLFAYSRLNFSWFQVILREKNLIRLCYLAILLLGGYQFWSANQSFSDMALRTYGSTTADLNRAERIAVFQVHSKRLNTLIKELKLSTPSTLFISQGGDGFVQSMARYYSIGNLKNSTLRSYKISGGWSWGPGRKNMWMRKTTKETFSQLISGNEIIWPYKLDDWTTSVLKNFTDDQQCRQDLSDYFLIKINNQFKCFSKNLN
tara:strand:+ start:2875 stop:4794 length:1920 start_codon:yes stop_codon:yes gene_type:complete